MIKKTLRIFIFLQVNVCIAQSSGGMEISTGDLSFTNPTNGVLARSTNNSCWKKTVNNNGIEEIRSTPCDHSNKGQFRITLSPDFGRDNYVNDYYKDQLSDQFEYLPIGWWTNNGAPTVYRSLIYFPIPGLPKNAVIDKAYLYLYYHHGTGIWQHQNNNEFNIKLIKSAWNEASTTWNHSPETSISVSQLVSSSSVSSPDKQIDITGLIWNIYNYYSGNFDENYGFEFTTANIGSYNMAIFGSSECPIIEKRPQLEIFYSVY